MASRHGPQSAAVKRGRNKVLNLFIMSNHFSNGHSSKKEKNKENNS